MNKAIRYIVQNPNENVSASYNAALGKNALVFAEQNARRYHGKIFTEYTDGKIVETNSFIK